MKVAYLPYIWIGIFLIVLAGVVGYRSSVEDFAKGEFGGVMLAIEYAHTPLEREQGLSGRTEIPDNYGMLFVFEEAGEHAFWMKDMHVPIDIFWLDAEKKVVSIKENALPERYPESYAPSVPALYVLETRAGFARDYGIATGTELVYRDISWFRK